MDTMKSYAKIYVVIDKVFAKDALAEFKAIGVQQVMSETGRNVLLKKSEGLKKLLAGKNATVEDSIAIFSFLVHPSEERAALQHLAGCLGIDVPGRGSIYSKHVRVPKSCLPDPAHPLSLPDGERKIVAEGLTGICCITQKGEGNNVAEIGLVTGTAVPAITFGTGTGLRNRLGLWRILIPAEKEITSVVVDKNDAETVMDMMINAGQLDQPGKGFIYDYPVNLGIMDTKFFEGGTSQAASIEQIISAIDEMKGSTEWRKKALSSGGERTVARKYLNGLVNFSMICNEGQGELLTAAAMAAGAAGATISLAKHIDLLEEEGPVSPAREVSVMTIGEGQVETVLAALEEAGLFGEEASGDVHISHVNKACTFLGAK